ncbi:uncharacterized protein N7469_007625, partial [Penicillium citrinum]
DWEAKNSILVTWQISFNYIRERRPSAAELLSFMNYFDRQSIPEKLIRNQPENNSDDGELSESDKELDFEDDIMILRDFSFITISEINSYFRMHRLVQLTMRRFPPVNTNTGRIAGRLFLILNQQYLSVQNHSNADDNRLLYFIKVYIMRGKTVTSLI